MLFLRLAHDGELSDIPSIILQKLVLVQEHVISTCRFTV